MKTKDALAIGIKLGRLQRTLDAWEESKHPRANNGQFSHSAGGGPSSLNTIAYAATGEIRPCPRCGSWRHFD